MLSFFQGKDYLLYKVDFYEDKDGKSEIGDYLKDLEKKAETSKQDRVNHEKILTYIEALEIYGTRIGKPYVKHIVGKIWELRPRRNRIFFFYWKDNKFVLLHHFIKKTMKTPPHEIEIAKAILRDYIERNGE